LFEFEEAKKVELINELKKGEESGYLEKFNRDSFLKNLHNANNPTFGKDYSDIREGYFRSRIKSHFIF